MSQASSHRGSQAGVLPRLWLARVDAPLPLEAATWLDAGERERIARFNHAEARRSRIVAWSLRRWALSQARPEISPAAWRFVPGPHGKPELDAAFATLGLQHNISHAGAYAAVVLADAPCGVDVELPPAGLEAATVAFGPRERAAIAAHARPAERFLQHWAFKEATLKLLGIGILWSPERLELAIAPDGRSATPLSETDVGSRLPGTLTLRSWPLPDHHLLAVALSRPADLRPEHAPWSDARSG